MTPDDYRRAFDDERGRQYPIVDDFEATRWAAIDRDRLETAARILACPVKANPPNWQHGRVIYAAVRQYLVDGVSGSGPVSCVDIGTAKGFSALCLRWALDDAGVDGHILSVDVLEPTARVKRNTVVECDGFKTLAETLADWPEARRITFKAMTGIQALSASQDRIHIAFVDGKHTYAAVKDETALLAKRQQPGDLAIFDDTQIDGVGRAVQDAEAWWTFTYLQPLESRRYAVGIRRG